MVFLAVAIFPRETEDVQATVARLMGPYDQSLPVPPYKKYVSEKSVKYHTTHLDVSPGDLQTLAERMNAHYAATLRVTTHYQADAVGIYSLLDTNPNGKYKRWSLNSLADNVWPVSALPRDLTPHAVITPDGQWHELFPNMWGSMPTVRDKLRIGQEAYALIDQYPDHLAARLECQ